MGMTVVNIAVGADTGGVSYGLHQAFARHSDINYRSLVRSTNYINYPRDMAWQLAANALTNADVIHANNTYRTLEKYWKPSVIHYHGTGFREHPEAFLEVQRAWGGLGVVSTLDLWLLAPDEVTWLPAPYDLDWLAGFRKVHPSPKLRVGHAPTAREIKSTDRLIAAVNRIPDAELVLVERQPWRKCLQVKGTVDVFFDQVLLGYGNNAIEAWGMGVPVIAGGSPDTLAEMRNRFGELPFYEATEDTIYDALMVLSDEVARKEWGDRGRLHAERFHSERAVVERMWPVYDQALIAPLPPHPPQPQPPVRPVGVRRGPRRHRRRR